MREETRRQSALGDRVQFVAGGIRALYSTDASRKNAGCEVTS